MIDESPAPQSTPSVQSLPAPHPQRVATKPRQAKGGHKRHLRAPIKSTAPRANTAKHSLRGE
jgi:hypothetical protein